MPPKTKYRKYAAKKRAGARKRVTKPSKTLVKQVQSIISKNVETKSVYYSAPMTAYNSVISVAGDIGFILPDISQGTAEGNRIGDQVRGQKLVLDGFINMNLTFGGNTNATRLGVRVFVVQPKLFSSADVITNNFASWLPFLLRKGNSGVPFGGTIADLYAPVNSEIVTTYYDKVHYMNIPYMLTQAGQMETAYSYKHFRHVFKLNNKKLLYDSGYGSNSKATNFSPVILIGYCHLDGSNPDNANTQISMSYTSLLDFEDA